MTTKDDWKFRAYTLREAANYLRNRATEILHEAKRYEELADNSEAMAAQTPQESE